MDIKSKNVYTETYSYTSISIPEQYSDEEFNDAYAELNVFRKHYYGESLIDAPEIELVNSNENSITLRFATVYEMSGKDLNPLVYPNAVDSRDLM